MRLPDQIVARTSDRETRIKHIIDRIDADLFANGIQITLETDFQSMKAISNGLEKLPLTPNFDPDVSRIGPENGLWMHGRDFSGRTVLTQGARYYDLKDRTAALLHESLQAFYADPASQAEQGETCRCEAPAMHTISGRVCYHGELWLAPPFRGRGLSATVSKLLMATVLLRWQPDYLFAVVQPGVCLRGVAAGYGYRNMQPHGMIWTVPSKGTLDEWVVWYNAAELEGAVTRP